MSEDLLHKINLKHRMRDPLYGFIWLTQEELEIIDTPIFQRLRRISQLALTKYVYPSAEHSRFVHSLGVLQCATNIFLELVRNSEDLNKRDDLDILLKKLRFAALLHDIGHLAYSHASEQTLLGDTLKHEDVSKYIIQNYEPIKHVLLKCFNDATILNRISSLAAGKVIKEDELLKKIISGVFDADRADYLIRDSYICGVKYGQFDVERFIGSFIVKNGQYCIRYEHLNAVELMVFARYQYNMQVPFHRTRQGYDIVLSKFIEKQKENIQTGIQKQKGEIVTINYDTFVKFDDYYVFELIKKFAGEDNFAKILMRDKAKLHPVFDYTCNAENAYYKKLYEQFIKGLISEGLEENVSFFKTVKNVKIYDLLKISDEQNESDYKVLKDDKLIDLFEMSPVLFGNTNANEMIIYRVYVDDNCIGTAKKVLQNVMNKTL